MRCFHATRDFEAVLADGWVRPMRMPDAYAFDSKEAAEAYAAEFGYEAVVEVEVPSGSKLARWRPSYAGGASVIKVRGPLKVVLPA